MARPKSKLPTKSIVRPVRMTPEGYEIIKKNFGSLQAAVDLLISTTKKEK